MNCKSLAVILSLSFIFSINFFSPSFFSIASASATASRGSFGVHAYFRHTSSSRSSVSSSINWTCVISMVFARASRKSDLMSANSGFSLGFAFGGKSPGFSPGRSLMAEMSIGKKSLPSPLVHCAHIWYSSSLTQSLNLVLSSLTSPLLAKPLETTKWKTWRNTRPSNKSHANNFTSSAAVSCMSLPMACATWSKYRAKAALAIFSS
mmetsp:Transcript_89179/g.273103  ORF Transcript_89179/g.273103 Transcript_89179/m.273103 type:complete len:207 (-) Transcript_89179:1231-1851(-)